MSRQMVITFYLLIPLSFFTLFMKSFFMYVLGQEEVYAIMASEFVIYTFPGTIFFSYSMCY